MKIISQYNITLKELSSLNDSEKSILESLNSQLQSKDKLSEKQNDLLTKILNREFNYTDISNIEYSKHNLYIENYYEADYNGDYLLKRKYVLLQDESPEIINEKIQNLIARQYNHLDYTNKYTYESKIAIPTCIKNTQKYLEFQKDFEKLITKFPRARTSNSKYNIVKAIKTILSEEYNTTLIDNILRYKNWN